MTRKLYESEIDAPVEALWEFHQSVEALRLLTPPDRRIQIVGDDVAVRDGAVHKLKVKQFGIWMRWDALISDVNPPHGFVDTALKSPFASWRHHHEFLDLGEGRSVLRDTIDYQLPMGPFGALADRWIVSSQIDEMFAHRHAVTIAHFGS